MQHLDQPAFEKVATQSSDFSELFGAWPSVSVRAALVGRGIRESRTPSMHMAEGARLGIPYAYRLLDFDELGLAASALPALVRAAASHGLAGLNVTHPFKQSVIACLDELSPDAAAIGAVNTIVLRDGKAVGHNTDCWGFAESFRQQMASAALDLVLLVGAGGAGMAVGRALLDLGARKIAVFDLDGVRAAALAASLQSQFGAGRAGVVADLGEAARTASGVVNATPVGMAKYPGSPIPVDELRPELWVADVVYFPAETELLRAARAVGSRTMPGRGMAIFQAVKAFELFTGIVPDAREMARQFEVSEALRDELSDGRADAQQGGAR